MHQQRHAASRPGARRRHHQSSDDPANAAWRRIGADARRAGAYFLEPAQWEGMTMSELKSAAAKWPARTMGDGAAGQEDRMRPLTPAEREWKESIYDRLLKVLDLSLLATVEDKEARRQIREVCDNLIAEERAPLSLASR